ncbi:AAA family ATPase [Actinopolymorpha alba]|uniref:AAA family ATPase n=1 Tax=Actinopolymorpha alba TaxID=533267 RepID=UPI0003827666|nr:AAA family ATPase [Actinopolymorpha alba]
MPLPTLIVVSGPPGSGKTTLAHEIARAVGCPAICRDEIKEGMVHANPGFTPCPGDPLTMRTLSTFFDVLRLLLSAGATVVAEAAFQDRVWRQGLEPLTGLAEVRIIQCVVDAEVAYARITRRIEDNPVRKAHVDEGLKLAGRVERHNAFVHLSLPVPTMRVEATDGYQPGLADIVAFINKQRPAGEPRRSAPTQVLRLGES